MATDYQQQYRRGLLLTGLMRQICALDEYGHAVLTRAMSELDEHGMHGGIVAGTRLDSKNGRGMRADVELMRVVMGEELYAEVIAALDETGRTALLQKLRGVG